MINFTVGPVQTFDEIRKVGSEQVPYFRTKEFSEIMIQNEKLFLEFTKAPKGSRVIFLTSSSSGAMEAIIINTLSKKDNVLVVNGGSFGERFVELLKIHEIPYEEIKLVSGKQITPEILAKYENKNYTAFIVQKHETSTGVHFDLDLIGEFCKKNNLFLLVDNVSSFLCDEFDMTQSNTDVMITGSQKALACAPGIAVVVLSPVALERINKIESKNQYFNFKLALSNQDRGQTPWTPAVSILLQINKRLNLIKENGGLEKEINRCSNLANYFRNKIKEYNLPFEITSESLSNAVTPLHPLTQSAYQIFIKLKDYHDIWVCPNSGEMKDTLFRVGHMGNLTEKDYDKLLTALLKLREEKFI